MRNLSILQRRIHSERTHNVALQQLLRQPIVLLALLYVIVMILVAVGAPIVATHDPLQQNLRATLQGPSAEYWLGTDQLGRDVFSRIVYGTRTALLAAFQATAIAIAIGVPLGLLAGFYGGWFDRAMMWIVDVMYALPTILVALGLIAVIGASLSNAMIAVGIALSRNYIRLARGVVLAEREELYIDSARAIGMRDWRILFRHLLPNILPSLIVQTSITLGLVILIESTLSFLGLGVEVGQPSWGLMLADSRIYLRIQPFAPIPPGFAITFAVLAFNLLGDGLRDSVAAGGMSVPIKRENPLDDRPSVAAKPTPGALVSVCGLEVRFPGQRGSDFAVLDDISLDIFPGQTVGIVGESGSGKTMTAMAMMDLIPQPGWISRGAIYFEGQNLRDLPARERGQIRGREIGMVFQETVTALNPSMRVRPQLTEPMTIHLGISQKAAEKRALELLDMVGIANPRGVLELYPHQLSGGMAQRVMIARALGCKPRLLIADEPTASLDVTVQAQVLETMQRLQRDLDMSILFIGHDLGVIAQICQYTAVMYAGQIVEQGPTHELFRNPQHPYTLSLLQTMPHNHHSGQPLPTIEGTVPLATALPQGCNFHPRCPLADATCRQGDVPLQSLGTGRMSRCHHIDRIATWTTAKALDNVS